MTITNNIIEKAQNFFKSKGYEVEQSQPLITPDTTLLFSNASITPFKPAMISSSEISKTMIVQDCFRNHYRSITLYFFEMLGIVSNHEYLLDTSKDTLFFLNNQIKIDPENIHLVLHHNDYELIKLSQNLLKESNIHYLKNKHSKYCTRWEFGYGDLLTGKGLTIVVESDDIKECGSSCNILCDCNKFFPIGNIIIITNNKSRKKYVDIGIGIPSIEAISKGNSYFNINPYANIISELKKRGFIEEYAIDLSRHIIGAEVLLSRGIKSGNKKESYVLKRIFRNILEILLKVEIADSIDIPQQLNISKLQLKTIPEYNLTFFNKALIEEEAKYSSLLNKSIGHIEKYLSSKDQSDKDKDLILFFKDTYGIPKFLSEKILNQNK